MNKDDESFVTYPGLTHAVAQEKLMEIVFSLYDHGYRVLDYWFPHDRMAVTVTLGLDLSQFGEPEIHEPK